MNEGMCSDCTPGKYSDEVSAAQCKDCSAGKYSSAVGATSASSCTNCAAGKYSSATGATSVSTCTDCLAGQYSGHEGAVQCTFCESGKLSRAGETQCYTETEMFGLLGGDDLNAAYNELNTAHEFKRLPRRVKH